MTETVETSATTTEEKPRTDGKKPKKIRITLFYDGTLNNRMNIEEREKEEVARKNNLENLDKKGYKIDEGSMIYSHYHTKGANSYDNGRTNIAIMEPHVSGKKKDYAPDYDLIFKAYIAGQGPVTHKGDDAKGYALAIGSTGVPGRAEEGIDKAANFILNEIKENFNRDKHYIEKLTIDVFGFSRGAATARYAIHVLFHGRVTGVDETTGTIIYEWYPLFQRLTDFRYEIKESAVEVRFAGLYDTVLSYIGSQKMPRWFSNNILEQRAVAKAKKSLHLAAAEEHRADFPLHKIKSAIDEGKGEEYYLPGVHSDVGGSYNQANEKLLEQETVEKKKEYMRTSGEGTGSIDDNPLTFWGFVRDEAMVINEGDPKVISQDRADLIEQGWYKENEIKVHDVQWGEHGVTRSILAVSRQNISSAYSNIPLKIMAKAARKPDVKIIIDTKLEDRADIIIKTDDNLVELEKKIDTYITSHRNNSKPEDWLTPTDKTVDKLLKENIRNRHFHFSASKMSVGYSPNFEYDNTAKKYVRRRFYYDG